MDINITCSFCKTITLLTAQTLHLNAALSQFKFSSVTERAFIYTLCGKKQKLAWTTKNETKQNENNQALYCLNIWKYILHSKLQVLFLKLCK